MNKQLLQKLFPELEDELHDELLLHGTVKEIKAGETLLRAGQTIRSTLLIVNGFIKLYREDDEGNEFFIYNLQAGQACSLSLVCTMKHQTSEVLAKALTDAVVLSVPLEYMEKWMHTYKSWYSL